MSIEEEEEILFSKSSSSSLMVGDIMTEEGSQQQEENATAQEESHDVEVGGVEMSLNQNSTAAAAAAVTVEQKGTPPTPPLAGNEDTKQPEEGDANSSSATTTATDNNNNNNDNNKEVNKERWYNFEGVRIAKGYNLNGVGRGALVMSNIFLSSSFLYLANKEAGCLDENDKVIEGCSNKVYGFKPASYLSNIALLSGLLAAFFMPWIGAIIDYTPYRRATGVAASILMIAIQTVQIGTVEETWFIMSWFQAIAGFLYQVNILAIYAYLPDISRIVGQTKMNHHTSTFTMTQFGSQSSFLLAVIVLSLIIGSNAVVTAQMSQVINVVWTGLFFYISWRYYLEDVPPNHELPPDTKLFVQGFKQLWHTIKDINDRYKGGLRWYFLTLAFAEASVNAFTTLSVVYLTDTTGLNSTEIGVFFFVTLVFSIPGAWMAKKITAKLNPKRSWVWSMVAITIWVAGGAWIMTLLPKFVSFLWGAGIGILLGWFYPTENLFFAMILPKGQEAELSGFFVYCTQILGWLPPIIFTAVIEANVSQTVATILIVLLFLPPAALFMATCSASYEDILIESGRALTSTSNGEIENEIIEENNDMASAALTEAVGAGGAISTAISSAATEAPPPATAEKHDDNADKNDSPASDEEQPKQEEQQP